MVWSASLLFFDLAIGLKSNRPVAKISASSEFQKSEEIPKTEKRPMIPTLLHDQQMVRIPVSPCDNTVKACASVIDVFYGVGDLTHGFKIEGFPVVRGIDVDEACRYPFETNNDAPFICRDVAKLSSKE